MWHRLGVSCWPTLLILGPEAQPLFSLVGEFDNNVLQLFVKCAVKYFTNSLKMHQLPQIVPAALTSSVSSSSLYFPGKVTCLDDSIAISDSGHHRVVIIDSKTAEVKICIGGPSPGFLDGSFTTARFNSPQGLVFLNDISLYVADTENHAIRHVCLKTKTVTTVVGTGHQGNDLTGGLKGTLQAISSPWDVCLVAGSDIPGTNEQVLRLPLPSHVESACHQGPPGPPPPPLPPNSRLIPSSSAVPTPPTGPSPPPLPPSSTVISPPAPIPPPLPANSTLIPPPPAAPIPSLPTATIPPPNPPKSKSSNGSTNKVLLIAMSGSHQIWALFLEDTIWWKGKKYEAGTCVSIAGSGREENRNSSYPMAAAFAQPSGLSYSAKLGAVLVADSESSTVRKLLLSDGAVSNVVGGDISPMNLFSYGDVDGIAMNAKLQHPLGVAFCENETVAVVADTYNHKLKMVDVLKRECLSLDIPGAGLVEPGGLCIAGELVYVADTNNHTVKIVNLKTRTINELQIKEPKQITSEDQQGPSRQTWEAETKISEGGGHVEVNISLPPGTHGRWKVVEHLEITPDLKTGTLETEQLSFGFKVSSGKSASVIFIHLDLVLCGEAACLFKKCALKLIVTRVAGESSNSVVNMKPIIK